MKRTPLAIAVALVAAAVPTIASAQLAFNVGVTTDYRYRGLSQTQLKPAVQGGVDFAAGGFYVGAWASTIRWIKTTDLGGDSSVEIDLYGGYKGEIAKGIGFDVGVLAYVYPSNKLKAITGADADTQEIYGALTFGPVTFKYSHALSNLFGTDDSKNSYYADLSATFEVFDGWSLTPHLGYQKVNCSTCISYTDYSLTVSKDFKGLVPSIAIVGTNKKDDIILDGKKLGKTSLVVGLKYNF